MSDGQLFLSVVEVLSGFDRLAARFRELRDAGGPSCSCGRYGSPGYCAFHAGLVSQLDEAYSRLASVELQLAGTPATSNADAG